MTPVRPVPSRRPPSPPRPRQLPASCPPRAFSLAETLISVILVAGLVVAALNTVGGATVGRQNIGDRTKGQLLAQDLISEILRQAYIEPDETPTFGPEAGESLASRYSYDDVDDYHDWNVSPPRTKDNTTLPEYAGWRRWATVEWVDPNDPDTVGFTDTGVKRITVGVEHNDILVASMVAVRASATDALKAFEKFGEAN